MHGIGKSDDAGKFKALWPWRRCAGVQEDGQPAAVAPGTVLNRRSRDLRPRKELTPSLRDLLKSPWTFPGINPRSMAYFQLYAFEFGKRIFVGLNQITLSSNYSFAIDFVLLIKYSF